MPNTADFRTVPHDTSPHDLKLWADFRATRLEDRDTRILDLDAEIDTVRMMDSFAPIVRRFPKSECYATAAVPASWKVACTRARRASGRSLPH